MSASDALPSWADTPTRTAILDFVAKVTDGPDAVPTEARIAVFDNDGTLWTEKPMPTQLHYIVQQWKAAAADDPSLADKQPYKAAASGDLAWLAGAVDKHYAGNDSDLKTMIGAIVASSANLSVDEYAKSVSEFYATAKHLVLGRSYLDAVYTPMVELLRYLEGNGFTCYIVSGGERDFMRPMTESYYGIPPERVIGSALGLTYDEVSRDVRIGSTFDFLNDGPLKPIRIWSRMGRRPIFAAGNSNGDMPMLDFVKGNPASLSLLIHHDDDNGRGDAPYDKGAENALAAADAAGYTVVSVRDDWEQVFPEAD